MHVNKATAGALCILCAVSIVASGSAASRPKSTNPGAHRKTAPLFAHRAEEHQAGRGRKLRRAPAAPPVIEVFKDFNAWWEENRDGTTLAAMGKILGVDHFVHAVSELEDGISPNADVVLITSNSFGIESTRLAQNSAEAQGNLEAFVRSGGVLVVDIGDNDSEGSFKAPGSLGEASLVFPTPADNATLAPGTAGPDGVRGTGDDHRLVRGVDGLAGTPDDLSDTNIDACCFVAHGNLADGMTLPSSARVLMTAQFEGVAKPVVAEYCLGAGRVVVDTVTKEFSGQDPVGSGPGRFIGALLAYALDGRQHVGCGVTALRESVRSMLSNAGMASALDAKLAAAEQAVEVSNDPAACSALKAFTKQLAGQRNKKVPAGAADAWTAQAASVRSELGCR